MFLVRNTSINECSWFIASTQKGPFMAMLISHSRGTHLNSRDFFHQRFNPDSNSGINPTDPRTGMMPAPAQCTQFSCASGLERRDIVNWTLNAKFCPMLLNQANPRLKKNSNINEFSLNKIIHIKLGRGLNRKDGLRHRTITNLTATATSQMFATGA